LSRSQMRKSDRRTGRSRLQSAHAVARTAPPDAFALLDGAFFKPGAQSCS
jgi:hypothetical protein